MKILFISNLYGFRARGGAERVVEIEADALRESGHDVVVVSGVPESDTPPRGVCVPGLPEELCDAEIGFNFSENEVGHFMYYPPNSCFYTDLDGKSWLGRLAWHWLDIFNWRSAKQMERIIDTYQPDVVHTHNLMGLGFAIPNLIWKKQLRHVHTVHDVQLLHPSGLLAADWRPHWPHEWIYIWLMKAMMGSPAVVLFPSEHSKQLHNRFGFFSKSTKVVLRNPVEMESGVRSQESGDFLFIGQLEEHKGIWDLLNAWERWGKRGESVLRVIGDGSLKQAIVDRMKPMEGAEFVGPIYGDGLERYFADAAFLVLPSRVIENAPMVVLEAYSRGVPVIAADVGGIPELVHDGETGFLFESGSVESLLKAFNRAISASNDLGENTLNIAKKMSVEKHIKTLESAYKQ